MFGKRKSINDVFTPRSSDVNKNMYIVRESLEKELIRSIRGSMHSFLFGESGNGKSWLYKRVFSEHEIDYVVANCASASIKKSIVDEIYSVCVKNGSVQKSSYSETKKAGIKAVGTAELAHQGNYEIKQEDKLIESFKSLSSNTNSKPVVIVFDNVETIFKNEDLMSELCDIIILLDDSRYSQYNVKFLIVGVPNQVLEYFSSAKNPASVGNRIEEISRVAGLFPGQVQTFSEKGFQDLLRVNIGDTQLKRLAQHIFDITLGVPQRLHEYCEGLSYLIEDNRWEYKPSMLDLADQNWLKKGLRENYSVLEKHLNADETVSGRRNQVIYALGKISNHQVNTTIVGEQIAKEFPNNAPESNSGIGQVLSHLAKGEKPVLKKVAHSKSYTLTDPRYLMCIRIMLHKDDETEIVRKKMFKLN
ncbi:AAA family ATPase [Thalassomonas sp. RHCl1]|uniref:AAA family ATPase n=1 Tax=Thalassomonas sp. RHCl1 TaxID=2995320 RepID=UPI00248C2745|nr:AAA family ATPase [Thalassomonas sp. RHCl1]